MIWKLIGNVKSFLDKCKRDKINAYSAQSAFFIILSIIPFLMVFSSLLQYTSVTESMLLEIIRHLMPEYVSPFLISLVDEVYSRSMGIISITAIIAIWSAAKGVQYMTDGLNSVNDLEETRNWFVLRFWAVVYTVVFLVAIVFTLLVLVFGNQLKVLATQYVPILEHASRVLAHFRRACDAGAFDCIFRCNLYGAAEPEAFLPRAAAGGCDLRGSVVCLFLRTVCLRGLF